MNLLLMILGSVLGAVLIAYLIVKFLPLNLRWIPSILLLVLAIFLGYKIYGGIMEPIIFAKEKVKRFSPVIKNLKTIRDAQIKYYEVNSTYTKDKNGLIKFVDTAKLAITETKTVVQRINKGTRYAPVYVEEEVRVTDTIGYEPVLKYFKDRDYKSMFNVPGADGLDFELETGNVRKSDITVPTFRARTPKKGVLKGMNNSLIKQELEAIETDQIKGDYISVGSLDEISTGGNWPPSYDKKSGDEKKQ